MGWRCSYKSYVFGVNAQADKPGWLLGPSVVWFPCSVGQQSVGITHESWPWEASLKLPISHSHHHLASRLLENELMCFCCIYIYMPVYHFELLAWPPQLKVNLMKKIASWRKTATSYQTTLVLASAVQFGIWCIWKWRPLAAQVSNAVPENNW